ncbi:transglutaminase TgpA family protein [Pseudoneobacillus sp. C159]
MSSGSIKRNWETFFLYAFGFVLLWEWIRPLEELTDTGHIYVFIFYIVLSFVLAFFEVRIWLSFLIKVFYILCSVHIFYFEGGFLSLSWITHIANDFINNLGFVFEGNWTEMTNVFRTIMFFLLLWLMTYLIHYWLLNRKRIFLFFAVTLIYITVLDTFTPYSAKGAIIRAVVTGFAAMGILTLNRILTKENLGRDFSFLKKWLSILTSLIVLSVSIGYIAPKAEPIWPDPVPFIKSLNEKSGNGGTGKIGYGVDDSRLGGPFTGDNSIVFQAETESKHYWKVETKDFYTGKGWVVSNNGNRRVSLASDLEVPLYDYEGEVESKERKAIIIPFMAYPHIVYPFGVRKIQTQSPELLELDLINEKIYFENGVRNNQPYSFVYEVPRYSVTKLQQVKSGESARLDNQFLQRYTQLPTTLPPEVHRLAREITDGQETWFDKARAVEKYFKKPPFIYDQKNVAVPRADDDYVAQFLFETQRGYCDNFSTSMVVLLRAVGIPARWVKGYSGGEYKWLGEESRKVYEITNNNAHSWVEVYFPGSGWLAFEPTPGFANNVTLNFDTYKEETQKDQTPVPAKKPEVKKPDPKDTDTNKSSSGFSFKLLWLKAKLFLKNHGHWVLLGGLVLVVITAIAYRKRANWMPYYLLFRYKFKKTDDHFAMAYLALLKQLDLYGLKRKPDQTLREYAKYVDSFFSSREMTRLTDRYEHLIYKGTLQSGTWQNSKELWENLIKKTIA